MAEYKLSYTGQEIDEKLKQIDNLSTYVTPQMFGAVGDGVHDDTEAIQAALDASSFVYIPDGTYMINSVYSGYGYQMNGGIKPKNGQTIIMSNNATLKAIPNSSQFYNIVNLFNVNNVIIRGGKIEGDKDYHTGEGGEWGHGIAIRACNNITIEGVESFNCWGDSIDIGKGGIANCTNIRIYNCKLHHSRRQGISITGATDVVIRDCEIYDIRGTQPQSGIDIEPDGVADVDYSITGVAKNIAIDGCYIHDTEKASIITYSANVANEINGVKISNCHLDFLQCLVGENILINGSVIGKIQLTTSKPVNGSNCSISCIVLAGGNGSFSNCKFTDETVSAIIVSDMYNYPNFTTDFLEFNSCYFRTSSTATYFIHTGACNFTDGIFPENLFKFTSCKIEMQGSCIFAHRMTHEMIIDNCEVLCNTAPYELFELKNSWDTKLTLNNSKFVWDGNATYLIGFGGYDVYTVDVFNCAFSNSTRCIYCSSSGNSGGKVRMFNNILTSEQIYNNHKLDMIMVNNIAKVLTTIPNEYVTETELNAKGYLTQHQSLSGYAKTADHYTKNESNNLYQPKGSYLTSVPVQSVNNQTGAVNLSASDVGAIASADHITKDLVVTYKDGTSETVKLVVKK